MSSGKSIQFGKLFRVLEKDSGSSAYSIILEHRQHENALLFESSAVAILSPQEIDAVKRQYVKLHDAFGCLGVLQLNSGETTILYLVTITGCTSVGKIADSEVYRITQTSFVSLRNQPQDEDYISEIKKLLHSGTFYFSRSLGGNNNSFDLSLCSQRQRITNNTDNRFFWNRMLHIHFLRFGIDTSTWLLKIICGSVEIRTVYIRHQKAQVLIASRLSCERVGTRFNVRGCNDEGHVANFVETEQAIYLDDYTTSYIQIRGSVPLFWEQSGVQVGSHKVRMSRGMEASAQAYAKHMDMIKKRYGQQVIVNLLGTNVAASKEGEAMLSHTFQNHHFTSVHNDVPHIIFDYHQECRGGNTKNLKKLSDQLEPYIEKFGVFFANGNEVIQQQKGTIRTNCLDCLDRTNCIQTFLGIELLEKQLKLLWDVESQQISSRFEEVFRQMWLNNGNEVSKMYAGTGAIQGGSKLIDGARSAARTIQNNLLDNSKQEAIDVFLLGNTLNSELMDKARMLLNSNVLHTSTSILRDMCKRYKQFTYTKEIKVAVGTYNVNGGKHFRSVVYKDLSLSDWLLDSIQLSKSKSLIDAPGWNKDDNVVDIFAVGFEEIVDLNASNIMAASSENATSWAEELQKVLSRDHEYVLLTYIQLVGVCLYVFIKPELIPFIKDVAVDSVKTGLGGATGNKGAVAIRFVLYASSMCFVCSHFAAGQSQVSERNADYTEISKKIMFPMGRNLSSHDYIFWCGDFNYRVDMDKETMKELIKNNMLDQVLQHDQLLMQRKEKKVFQDFIEGDITFPPTYKYDLFSDDYDTSDKCRAPAWTDRVLWKKRKLYSDEDQCENWNPGVLLHYGRADLKQSDHRPVIAIIQIELCCVDQEKRDQIFSQVLESVGPLDATIIIKIVNASINSQGSEMYDDEFMSKLLHRLSVYGEVVLVRFVEDKMWITFKEGISALLAAAEPKLNVMGFQLEISLKTSNWVQQTKNELDICSDNTVPLYQVAKCEENSKTIPGKRVPMRPVAPTPNVTPKPKVGIFSIPDNLHQPLQPSVLQTAVLQTAEKSNMPNRPPPPVPQHPNQIAPSAPPVPQRTKASVEQSNGPPSVAPPSPPSRSAKSSTDGAAPPIPARNKNNL